MVHPRHISSRARTAGSQPTSTNDGQEVSKKSKLGQFQISLMKMNTEKERGSQKISVVTKILQLPSILWELAKRTK